MSVRVEGNIIHLMGRCPAEDAEDLLRALLETQGASVEIGAAQRIHMAVLQVLLALCPPIRSRAATGPFSRDILLRLISIGDRTGKNS